MNPALERFCSFYRTLGPGRPLGLAQVYSQQIEFIDPAHRLQGLDAVENYFAELLAPLQHCHFEIEQVLEQSNEAYIRWTMEIAHPQLQRGKPIQVPGVTYLRFTEQIDFHRDYFDLGAMLYEQLPLLGRLIRYIKGRLGTCNGY